jgi:hypothetical protein
MSVRIRLLVLALLAAGALASSACTNPTGPREYCTTPDGTGCVQPSVLGSGT